MKKSKFTFLHPNKTKKHKKISQLIYNYIDYWLRWVDPLDISSVGYLQCKIENNTQTLIIVSTEEYFEKIMSLWYKELYYLFPHASMMIEPYEE